MNNCHGEAMLIMYSSKASAGIGLTRRIKPFVPLSTLKMLYNAIVLPYFDYCTPLWDNCGNTLKNRLQKFQNRAARIITGKSYDVPFFEWLPNLKWMSLEKKRINSKLLFVYKIINGHTTPTYEINSDSIMKQNPHIISETAALI